MSLRFGTSGVRGFVTDFTRAAIWSYTTAFIKHLEGGFTFDTVAVGMDLRPSSPLIAQEVIAAAKATGKNIIWCECIPTPAIAYWSMKQKIPCIMITGSHIPFDQNGMKFYRPDGEILKEDEGPICAIYDSIVPSFNTISAQDHHIATPFPAHDLNPIKSYLARYMDFFDHDILKNLKIGVYQHSSVARDILVELLTSLGGTCIPLGRSDTFVPIDTEAVGIETQELGKKWVKEYGLDVIVSTDGDGDRPLIADDMGLWLRGDVVGLLTARFCQAQTVVAPITCTSAIEKSGFFTHIVRAKIGSPYIIEIMDRCAEVPVVGFEANGGVLLGSEIQDNGKILSSLPTRDAMLPLLAIIVMSKKTSGIHKLVNSLPQRLTMSDRLRDVPREKILPILTEWTQHPEKLCELAGIEAKITDKNCLDGLRLLLDTEEYIHVRPSGNAPELRCYVESDSPDRANELLQKLLKGVGIALKQIA